MSIFHISVKNISKKEGRSAVQMSSYIAGEEFENERTGEKYDKEREDVISQGMIFREDIPDQLRTPEKFWNALEKGTPTNARLAKSIDAALPVEQPEKWQKIVDDMINDLSKQYNLGAVQWAIHDKKDGNPHVHFLIPNWDYKNGKFTQERQQGYVCRHKETGEQQIFKSVKDIPEAYERIPVMDPKTGEQKLGRRNEKMWLRGDIRKNDLDKITFVDDLRLLWETNHNRNVTVNLFVSRLSNKARGIQADPTVHLGFLGSLQRKREIQRIQQYIDTKAQEIRILKKKVAEMMKVRNVLSVQEKKKSIQRITESSTLLKSDKNKTSFERFQEQYLKDRSAAENDEVLEAAFREKYYSKPEKQQGFSENSKKMLQRAENRKKSISRQDDDKPKRNMGMGGMSI